MELVPLRRHEPELLDQEDLPERELAGSLRDLRRVNRFLGGYRPILRALEELTARIPPDETLWILDVATGSADVPVRIVQWARRHGRKLVIVAIDINPTIAAMAWEYASDFPEIQIGIADARNLPFREGAFHISICSLTLHHFEPPEAARMIAEMARVSRCGIIINDLVREWPAYLWITLLTRILTRNRFTRHDGPMSVLRAYRPQELSEIARGVLPNFRIQLQPFYRMLLQSETPNHAQLEG